MNNTALNSRVSVTRLIMVPSLITLGVTLLRLIGELQHWSSTLFGRGPGGGAAIIGIAWLPFIFGPYFALKLSGAGEGPTSSGKAIGFSVLSLIVVVVGSAVAFAPQLVFPGKLALGLLVIAGGIALPFNSWPALGKTLLAYGFAARIPVAIVMFFAIRGNWGTHYDVLPPNFRDTTFWPKYIQIALLPQLVLWVAYTVIVGSLFGSIITAIARRGKPAPQTAM